VSEGDFFLSEADLRKKNEKLDLSPIVCLQVAYFSPRHYKRGSAACRIGKRGACVMCLRLSWNQ